MKEAVFKIVSAQIKSFLANMASGIRGFGVPVSEKMNFVVELDVSDPKNDGELYINILIKAKANIENN